MYMSVYMLKYKKYLMLFLCYPQIQCWVEAQRFEGQPPQATPTWTALPSPNTQIVGAYSDTG